MNFFELLQFVSGNVWLYGGAFVLVLSILVFVHEWGHYIVARMCGVRVEVFSIGFGRELFGVTDKKGTRWKFSLIPLGGYVKLFGDMDPASSKHSDMIEDLESGKMRRLTPAEQSEVFFAKPVWKRALVVFAGPGINYLFAILILTGLFTFNGQPVTPPVAAAVIGGSSAETHGFQPHDRVLSIDGKTVADFEDIRREMMISLDRERHFIVERGDRVIDIYAVPEKIELEDRFGFKHSRGMLGLISPRHAIRLDTIREIDGQVFDSPEAVRAEISGRMGTRYMIGIERGADLEKLIVEPQASFNEPLEAPAPGVAGETGAPDILYISNIEANQFVKRAPHIALVRAVQETWVVTRGTLEALGQMITGSRSATELGGVIRIGALAGDMAQQGLVALILFTALLSINLGLINLFPIPLLDGGHLVFYAFEALLGRPVPDQIQEYAFRIGMALLVGVMVFANLNDIMQLVL